MPAVRAPDPPNEAERMRALRGYAILDSEPEEGFDALTRLAAFICGMPISTITLIDEERQWFKSAVGTGDVEGPRDWWFCAYAVTSGEMFVVPDALEDERFATNPYVTGEPGIRFYAGAPLTTREGHTIGTLCVIDREPLREEEATRRMPIILLTARGQEADVQRGFDAGADDYMRKPFSPQELRMRVQAILGRR